SRVDDDDLASRGSAEDHRLGMPFYRTAAKGSPPKRLGPGVPLRMPRSIRNQRPTPIVTNVQIQPSALGWFGVPVSPNACNRLAIRTGIRPYRAVTPGLSRSWKRLAATAYPG